MRRLTGSDRASSEDRIVRCTIGDEHYAFRNADVRHIARVEQMRAETAADGRVGSLQLDGYAVPIFSLARVLGRAVSAPSRRADQHIAVTGEAGALVGWLVDRIVRTPLSASSDVVSLPETVGGPATRWFEALVRVDDESMLLLAPQYLNPLAPRAMRDDATEMFHGPPPQIDRDAKPMAVIFSTTVLPPCEARRFALSGRQIAAIVQPAPPIPVPGSAGHVTGVTWWRHAVVPVVDFRAPADRSHTAHRRCLIAQGGARLRGTLVAFSIDAEIEMHRPAAENHHLPGVPCPPFAAGMFDVSGESVALLDLDALLMREEGRRA